MSNIIKSKTEQVIQVLICTSSTKSTKVKKFPYVNNFQKSKLSFTLTMLRRFLQPHPVAGLVRIAFRKAILLYSSCCFLAFIFIIIIFFLLQPFFVFAVSPKLLNRFLPNLNHIYIYRGSRSERSIFQIFQIVFQI